jgi:hypothetical protein
MIRGRAATAGVFLLFLAIAAAVWVWAFPKLIERGCWLGEWPFENGCADYPTGNGPGKDPEIYLRHLERNPGDARAVAFLTHALYTRQDPRYQEWLPRARVMAPYNAYALSVQADVSLKAKDWPAAAEALVTLVERQETGAIPPLAAMMVTPETQSAVMAQLKPESTWLNTLLANLDPKVSPAAVQGFVAEGSRLGVLKPDTTLNLVDRLKQEGRWVDAYMLWVAVRGKVPEGLYNPSFDDRSLRRGFDWEWPEPAAVPGMRVIQTSASPNPGSMMELDLTGRAALPQPMMSQLLLLLAPQYRLTGQYMSDRMRTVDGLVWAFRCADGGERLAQSAPLKDTQRKWVGFQVDLKVPPQCRGGVRLQLETTSPGEAAAGMAGTVNFDDFELKPLAASRRP